MFLVSVILTALLQGPTGLGGLGSLIMGVVLARRFERAPVLRFKLAFVGALWPMALCLLIGGVLISYGDLVDSFEQAFPRDEARFRAWMGIALNAAVLTPILCATWAFFVVRKARRLAAAGLIVAQETEVASAS
jgi:hypothetical protein